MELEAYVKALEAHQHNPRPDLGAQPHVRLKLIPPAIRESLQAAATRAVRPRAARRARKFLQMRPLRLHFGCGDMLLEGWVNIDLLGMRTDLAWDLRKRLPFPDASVDAVFHEHLLEHLSLAGVLPLLRECRRLLRPGGLLRIGLPDFERYIRDYVQPQGFTEAMRPNRPTRLLALADVAYGHGHLTIWDGETLCLAIAEAGFQDASVRPFGESSIVPAPDTERRRAETVYVEAVCPP